MALPQGTTPANTPTQPPTTGQGIFIPQPTVGGQTKNISESPVLSSPSTSSKKNASIKTPNGKSNKTFIGIGLLIVLSVIGLIGGGLYFTRLRQNSSEQTASAATAKLVINPPSGTIIGGAEQTVDFSLELSATPVLLTDLEISVLFAGEVPPEIKFNPAQLSDFNPPDASVTDVENGKKLSLTYKSPPEKTYKAETKSTQLGTLTFTSPLSGEMTIRFSASDSKVIISENDTDILRPSNLITYSFVPPNTPTPEIIADAEENIASAPSSLIALASLTVTPSPTITLQTKTTTTVTPTITVLTTTTTTTSPVKSPTPTKTVAPTTTPQPSSTTKATPTPTTARQSSLPAETQEKPVSGSMNVTVKLILIGLLFIFAGFTLLKKTTHTKEADSTTKN